MKTLTTETNKKFAEFLGVKSDNSGWYEGTDLYNVGLPFSYGAMGNGTRDLKFHNDWNWLMLVIQEIANKTGYNLVINCSYSYWNKFGENPLNKEFGGYENIENIYQACSEFVDYYNSFLES